MWKGDSKIKHDGKSCCWVVGTFILILYVIFRLMVAISCLSLQTVFIISVCNSQLLDFIENELIRVLSFIPGVATILPNLIRKLHTIRDKYMSPSPPVSSNIKVIYTHISVISIPMHDALGLQQYFCQGLI